MLLGTVIIVLGVSFSDSVQCEVPVPVAMRSKV